MSFRALAACPSHALSSGPRRAASMAWLLASLLTGPAWAQAASAPVSAPAPAPAPLPSLGLNAGGTTVSGLSSGGYMAAQFEVVHAASIQGAAIVAGGPYGCSMGSVRTAALTCSCPYEDAPPGSQAARDNALTRQACMQLPPAVMASRALAAAQGNREHIDPISHLKQHRVWLYSGDADPVVAPRTVDGLATFYQATEVPSHQIKRVRGPRAGHGMPIAGRGTCELTRSPYLNGCQIDGAGELLKWLYARPSARPGKAQAAALRPFDQRPYRQAGVFDGLDDSGWVYVPARCEQDGARCKLHVAFHGCQQGQNFPLGGQPGASVYGTVFVEQAGYNRWAESMGLVVLYPQVLPSAEGSVTSPYRFNPKGCWDFWGYTSPLGDASLFGLRPPFARKDAPQIRAVQAMIDALLAPPATSTARSAATPATPSAPASAAQP